MNNPFETEVDAIRWVQTNTPIGIKPTKKAKTTFVTPFTSGNAFEVVTEELGKKLFELLNKQQ